MKIQAWDSFNFSETTKLFAELLKGTPTGRSISGRNEEFITQKVFNDHEGSDINERIQFFEGNEDGSKLGTSSPSTVNTSDKGQVSVEEPEGGNVLERSLSGMCKRGGFHGAVIADLDGLPIAVFNSPVNEDILAAYSTILGESLEKAASLLNQPDANNLSLDINILDKIVLRKFTPDKTSYYLMVISPQNIDERAEVEIAISQVSRLLQ